MLTKIKANFDFSKALNGLEETIDETMAEVGGENVKSIKQTIDKKGYGQYGRFTELSPTRLENREKGIGFPDKVRGVTDKSPGTPLKQSGNLYDSIKYKKDGIHMASYGITHNDGLPDKRFRKNVMPGRPFITIGMSRADLSKVEDNFTEKIKKLIKK